MSQIAALSQQSCYQNTASQEISKNNKNILNTSNEEYMETSQYQNEDLKDDYEVRSEKQATPELLQLSKIKKKSSNSSLNGNFKGLSTPEKTQKISIGQKIHDLLFENLKIQLNKKTIECNEKIEIEQNKAMEFQKQLQDQQKKGFQQEAMINQNFNEIEEKKKRIEKLFQDKETIENEKNQEIEKLKEIIENIKDEQERIWIEKMNQNQKIIEQNIKEMEENMYNKEVQLKRLCNFQKNMFKQSEQEPILKIGANILNKYHQENLNINIVVLNNLFDVDEIINEQNQQSKCKSITVRQCDDTNIYESEILIQFDLLASHFKVILVVVTTDRNILQNISQNASIQFSQSGQVVNLNGLSGYNGKSIVASQLFKIQNDWHLSNIEKSFEQQNIRKLITDNLNLLDVKLKLTENNIYCLKFDQQYRKLNEPIQIKCNETVPVPELCYQENFIISLGWKDDIYSEETTNLDSSILTFDSNGNIIDNIGVHNLRSKCKAFQHQGDVKQGQQVKQIDKLESNKDIQQQQLEGEEEEIHIDLNKINPKINNFWVFFSIEDENKTFDKVEGISIKFKAGTNEFCQYKFKSVRDGVRNGCLVCDVSRLGNRWAIKGRGYFTENTRKSQDVLHIISKIRKRKLEDIKIIKLTN